MLIGTLPKANDSILTDNSWESGYLTFNSNGLILKFFEMDTYDVGSSKKIIGGFVINSSATDNRFFWPPDRHFVFVLAWFVRPNISSNSITCKREIVLAHVEFEYKLEELLEN